MSQNKSGLILLFFLLPTKLTLCSGPLGPNFQWELMMIIKVIKILVIDLGKYFLRMVNLASQHPPRNLPQNLPNPGYRIFGFFQID